MALQSVGVTTSGLSFGGSGLGLDPAELIAHNSTSLGVDVRRLAADLIHVPADRRASVLQSLCGQLSPIQQGQLLKVLGEPASSAKGAGQTAHIATAALTAADVDKLARSLVRAGGTGTKQDVELVVAELKKLPASALQTLQAGKVAVLACRDSVTDHATDLKGVQPRGWPPGKTWDSVSGAYLPGRNAVVIAVVGHGTKAGAHVSQTGEGHGSANLVVHEAAHAINKHVGADRNASSKDFTAARTKDLAALPAYELQKGVAGLSETFAESAARYYGGSYGSVKTSNLDAYWRAHPLGAK